MNLPPLRALKYADHLPVSYEELRGRSYSDWHVTRKAIMKTHYSFDATNKQIYFLDVSRCISCEHSKLDYLFSKEGFDFTQCRLCDLIQVSPLLKPEVIDGFYNTREYNNFIDEHMIKKSDYRKNRFGTERVDAWERILGVSSSAVKRRSLDVGCGSGFVVEEASERGWDAHGIDLNTKAILEGQKKRLNLYNKKLETLDENDLGLFDVITMYDVLEHSYDPNAMLRAAHNLLEKDGLLVVYVPNWNSLARQILGNDIFWIWGLFHISYFTIETLSHVMRQIGFNLLEYETQGMDIADIVWWNENIKSIDSAILKENLEHFQFSCNAAGLAAGLRVYATK